MINRFVTLWHALRSFLEKRGDLPLEHEVLTPAEIAEAVRTAGGDERPRRFVWGYYYPRHFGEAKGELTDEEARMLVDSFEKRAEPPAPPTRDAEPAQADQCSVCGRKPARNTAEAQRD